MRAQNAPLNFSRNRFSIWSMHYLYIAFSEFKLHNLHFLKNLDPVA